MESEKVKERLKFCSEGTGCYVGCPYKHDTHCFMKMSKQALTLINELESENERLENKNYQLEQNLSQCENGYKLELHTARYQLHSANEDLKKAEKRIAELENEKKSMVKVVRCKRCKWLEEKHYEEDNEKPYIKLVCKITKRQCQLNDFCSYGEEEFAKSERITICAKQ